MNTDQLKKALIAVQDAALADELSAAVSEAGWEVVRHDDDSQQSLATVCLNVPVVPDVVLTDTLDLREVKKARRQFERRNCPHVVFVLLADEKTLLNLQHTKQMRTNHLTMYSLRLLNPTSVGLILRDAGNIQDLAKKAAESEQKQLDRNDVHRAVECLMSGIKSVSATTAHRRLRQFAQNEGIKIGEAARRMIEAYGMLSPPRRKKKS